jgi:hypothetical protein
MITLLLQLIIVAIVLGLIYWLVTQIPFMAPFARIVQVVVVVIFVIYVIYILMGLLGHPLSLTR